MLRDQAVWCVVEPYSLEYIRKHARAELMRYRGLSLSSYSSLHQFTSMHLTDLKLSKCTSKPKWSCSASGISVYFSLKMSTEKHPFQENLHFYI